MNKIRECIHRLRCNHTLRQLQRELGVHRSVVRNIRNVANQQSWLDPALAMPDDAQIEKAFSSSYANQLLAALSEAGLIYKSRHGKYSFAVPLLSGFIRRQRNQ